MARQGAGSMILDAGLVRKLRSYFVPLPANFGARIYAANGFTHSSTGNYSIVNTFDTERWDTGITKDYTNGFWAAANPERLTITKSGFYHIFAHVEWAANAVGDRGIDFYDDSSYILGSVAYPAATTVTAQSLSTVVRLEAGNYVRLRAYQSSGGNLNINASGASSWNKLDFGIQRIP